MSHGVRELNGIFPGGEDGCGCGCGCAVDTDLPA
jgi:hypothetical protein